MVALSAFDDRRAPPTARTLARALGKAAAAWTALTQELAGQCGPLQEEWSFAGAKYGWSLRLKRGPRVIVYMTPGAGEFLASFALGAKACAAAEKAGLPAAIRERIAEAPVYAEGRGVRIPVRFRKDVAGIAKLAAIKLAH